MKKSEVKKMVKVDANIHKAVAKKVAGTAKTIGQFFDEAANEKLKQKIPYEPI